MIQRDEDGKESGIGFVEFTNKDQAERALERDRKSMGHRWEGYGVWGYMSNRSALRVFSFAHNNIIVLIRLIGTVIQYLGASWI